MTVGVLQQMGYMAKSRLVRGQCDELRMERYRALAYSVSTSLGGDGGEMMVPILKMELLGASTSLRFIAVVGH